MRSPGGFRNLLGQRFGKLTVEDYSWDSKWLCRCDCGGTVIVSHESLKSGAIGLCGRAEHYKREEKTPWTMNF